MQNLLNLELSYKTHYLNHGNIFCKSLFLKDILQKDISRKGVLFIVENERIKQEYIKIFNEFKINIKELKTIGDLSKLLTKNIGNYIIEKDIFETELPNFYSLEKDYLLTIKKGDYLEFDVLVKTLINKGFIFDEYNNPGTYKKIGDILHITDFDNFSYKISFWGDTVEEIFLARSSIETEIWQEINLGSNSRITIGGTNSLNKSFLDSLVSSKIFIILDGINFYLYYREIYPKLNNYISFSLVHEKNTLVKERDLGIKELFADKIEDLKELLNRNNKKYIFTKNKKTIENFVEYNNFSGIEIFESRLNNLKSFVGPHHGKEREQIVWNKNFYSLQGNTPIPLCQEGDNVETKQSLVNTEDHNDAEMLHCDISKEIPLIPFINGESIFITDDIISKIFIKRRLKRGLKDDINLLLHIKSGDYVVHIDHGIGIYRQIIEKDLSGIKKEYLEIEYIDRDKLFVPITEVARVSKYVGEDKPKLTRLNTKEWSQKLKKVEEDIEKVAEELLELYAKRHITGGFAFREFIDLENIFRAKFPYIYTEDQDKSVEEILYDMTSTEPMDRLLTGDVGFGKTELAFNAIYRAFLNKKQSVLISPLVVLAYEHYDKAIERFTEFGLNIGVMTRLEDTRSIKDTMKKLKEGKIDLVIGTHRLLSEDIEFKDLGLLVVDEEHKFGVRDKDKIKKYRGGIDILSMSATPIPRSLNMALSKLRGMSMLTTPPTGRIPIETYVSKFDDSIIFEACSREFERGGQVFFIHNRVATIESMKSYLADLFPDKRIVITHGQLPGHELEDRIISFRKREYDILLSSTVIENGIDFPNVNTIIINDAYKFGISQIHQLRGRVGRRDRQGYCCLLYNKDKINTDAQKRLKTLVDYSHLGSGFELAIKDLEIRGGGDILGIKQSGQSRYVGLSLYIEMLEDKIEELKTSSGNSLQESSKIKKINIRIDLDIGAYIPDEYFQSDLDKINFYRDIENITSLEDLKGLENSFRELNPDFPPETQNLFDILETKIKANKYNIKIIKKAGLNYQIEFVPNNDLQILRDFLELDKEVLFSVISVDKIRCKVSKFSSDLDFLIYMSRLLDGGVKKKGKIRKKK